MSDRSTENTQTQAEWDPVGEGRQASAETQKAAGLLQMSHNRIRHILADSRDRAERDSAVEALLPQLWYRWPPDRYRALCTLTTRIYLPFGLHPMEWMSFPRAFSQALRLQQRASLPISDTEATPHRHHSSSQMPATHEERRTLVAQTLRTMVLAWQECQLGTGQKRPPYFAISPNADMGADICEALGRLGIYEAEEELLDFVYRYRHSQLEVRLAAQLALADMPPLQLKKLWQALKQGTLQERSSLVAAIRYLNNPEAVPMLLEILLAQTDLFHQEVSLPILERLGLIGDVRALPVLTHFAREGPESLRPTAQTAIRRLMKEAQGMEEVTLVRASALATLNQDMLLRPIDARPDSHHPRELLRPSATEDDPPMEEGV
jgi:hypothetical protein